MTDRVRTSVAGSEISPSAPTRSIDGPSGENRRIYLAKVARLYYLEQYSQREIARRLSISVASVSRAIAQARAMNIVRISIDQTLDRIGEKETAVERRWGLEECVLVPSSESIAAGNRDVAKAVFGILGRIISAGDLIGVGWGETLKAIGEHLGRIAVPAGGVIPIVGAMGRVETGIYPNSIAREFAERMGGKAYLMNTPALVDTPAIRDFLTQESGFREVLELWRSLSTVLLSVSGLDENTSVYRAGIFSSAELASLRRLGGVSGVNFTVLDQQGKVVDNPISDRIVNFPWEFLSDVRHVVCAAVTPQKAAPLRALLLSGKITRLVSDLACAEHLLAED